MSNNTKCLTDSSIQLFIDGELDKPKIKLVEQHLSTCPDCRKKVDEQSAWANEVKRAINLISVSKNEIPEFTGNLKPKNSRTIRHEIFPFFKIAALFVLMFGTYLILLENQKSSYKPSSSDILLWEAAAAGDDANRAWHERQITTLITDQNGEIKYFDIN